MKPLSIVLLMAAAVVAQDRPPEAPKRHRGEGRVYESKIKASLVPPRGWEQGKSELGSYLIFRGPADEARPSVNVTTFKNPGAPITTIGPGMKKAIAQGNKDWQFVEEGYTQVDGKRAYYLVSKMMYDFGDRKQEMQSLAFFVVSPSRGYVVTFLSEAPKFDGLRKTFEDAFKTFRGD